MDTLIKNYEDLANAIIFQAVVDYKRALKSKKKEAKWTVRECEKFFRSDYYRTLTNVDGELIISKIRGEIRDGSKHKRKAKRTKRLLRSSRRF